MTASRPNVTMLLANLKCVANPIFCWPKTGLPSQKFLEPPLPIGAKRDPQNQKIRGSKFWKTG